MKIHKEHVSGCLWTKTCSHQLFDLVEISRNGTNDRYLMSSFTFLNFIFNLTHSGNSWLLRVQEFYVKHMPMIGDSHVCIFIVQLIRTNSWQERLPCLEWIICLFRLQNGWRGDTFQLTWSRRHAFIFVNVADPRSHEVMGPAADTPAQKCGWWRRQPQNQVSEWY